MHIANQTATNLSTNVTTLLLPIPGTGILATTPVTTITGATFGVGDSAGYNSSSTPNAIVQFGSGLTTLNANTINVGTGARDVASLSFNPSATNGAITINDALGGSTAVFNLATGGATTGTGGANNLVNFLGHTVNITLATLNIGNQERNATLQSTFEYDTGSMSVTTVNLGSATNTTSSTAGTLTDNLIINGGTTTIGAGGVSMGTSTDISTVARTVFANLNIGGGVVTVANSGTYAIQLGNNSAASGLAAVNDTLNVTGGALTLSGDIVKSNTANTVRTTSNLILNGGTLNMQNNNIGPTTNSHLVLDSILLESGTLMNVLQINNGAAISKTTAGTLIMSGTNAYSGQTNDTAGMLLVNGGFSGQYRGHADPRWRHHLQRFKHLHRDAHDRGRQCQ